MLKTDWPVLLRHMETALAAAFPVKELAVGAEGTAVGVAVVGNISKKKLVLFLLIPFLPPK